MLGIVAGLVVVPLVDLGLKRILRQRLRGRAIALGRVGAIRPAPSSIWLARLGVTRSGPALWTAWCAGAAGVAGATALVPEAGWCAGLMLGGSLSHAIESSRHGGVSDYVRLRFWPAFNLADAAIAVGGLGVLLGVIGR